MASLHVVYIVAGYLLTNGQITSLAWLLYFSCLSCLAISQIAFSFINHSKTYEKTVSVSVFKAKGIESHNTHSTVLKEETIFRKTQAQNIDSGKLISQADVGEGHINHGSDFDPEAVTAVQKRDEDTGKF